MDDNITHGHWNGEPPISWCGVDISDWIEEPFDGTEKVDCIQCLEALSPELKSYMLDRGLIRELVCV